MPSISTADHDRNPPVVSIPRRYNAASDLIGRNLAAGRGGKAAFIDANGTTTYAQLAERVDRFAGALGELGIRQEERILLCLLDTVDFPTCFLGAIKAGVVPIAANTLLTTEDYRFQLEDSRAAALVVSAPLLDRFAPLLGSLPHLRHVIVAGADSGGHKHLPALLAAATPRKDEADTTSDDICFWLYSSGSTGTPKGTVHLHSHLILTAELYARPVLGIREDDVVFSAAKLFFAYGLGNALTFPMAVGATAVLLAERPTPDAVFRVLTEHRPTIFYGVPTLFAAMLAHPGAPPRELIAVRRCASAGEALPEEIGQRWTERYGSEILDGIGSTEMLHIFLSNRPGQVRYGTTGVPVPGYEVALVDDEGRPVARGEIGELRIKGPTAALFYWNNRARTRATFIGDWTRSGDKYVENEDGTYTYCGRTDDMLKVGGIYVSPFEVEATLMTHPAVLEAAVIGRPDEAGLIKPKAYIVLKPGTRGSDALLDELREHCKSRMAPYKYPRWMAFIDELPKTATGKIQRFKLRALERETA